MKACHLLQHPRGKSRTVREQISLGQLNKYAEETVDPAELTGSPNLLNNSLATLSLYTIILYIYIQYIYHHITKDEEFKLAFKQTLLFFAFCFFWILLIFRASFSFLVITLNVLFVICPELLSFLRSHYHCLNIGIYSAIYMNIRMYCVYMIIPKKSRWIFLGFVVLGSILLLANLFDTSTDRTDSSRVICVFTRNWVTVNVIISTCIYWQACGPVCCDTPGPTAITVWSSHQVLKDALWS